MIAQSASELEDGRGGQPYFDNLIEKRARVRELFAGLLGTTPYHVAVTASTTTGCQIVLSGLRLEAGDEIVTTDEEHFGLLGPLHVSGARVRVAATRGRTGQEALEAVLREVGPRTRLVALSHVSWMTGHILPVAEIKAQTGLPLLVDGAQSVGAIPVDLGDVDFYTVSGQKWLCGPDATGALYVRDVAALAVTLPTYWSREAHEPDGTFEPVEGAQRFDTGPIPVPSLVGLEVALRTAPPSGYDDARAITGRCRELLSERVHVVTAPDQATLVTFVPKGDAAEAVARLFDGGVVVREIPDTGWVRVSCGYWNTEEHVQRLLAALA
jgi:L-cysteine/cystine lyase